MDHPLHDFNAVSNQFYNRRKDKLLKAVNARMNWCGEMIQDFCHCGCPDAMGTVMVKGVGGIGLNYCVLWIILGRQVYSWCSSQEHSCRDVDIGKVLMGGNGRFTVPVCCQDRVVGFFSARHPAGGKLDILGHRMLSAVLKVFGDRLILWDS